MHDQPKYEPFEESHFFKNGRSQQDPVEGTETFEREPSPVPNSGKLKNGQWRAENGRRLSSAVLSRGQDRFNIYCTPCHDRVGTGEGMIVKRGFKKPPNLHDPRLRNIADGYLFEVASNGFGVMAGYSDVVSVEDRWAIVAYIRALQLSQNMRLEGLSPEERSKVEATP
jgi:mono/diheme cytochrome c family protein